MLLTLKKKMKRILITLFVMLLFFDADAQKLSTRLSYITDEAKTEILISKSNEPIIVTVNGEHVDFVKHLKSDIDILEFESSLLKMGDNIFIFNIGNQKDTLKVKKLAPSLNEVKIDRFNGLIYADGLPLVLCGFYAYTPVQMGLLEEEAIRGLNLFSPYQPIEHKTRKERIKYLDRCAELGMKVNYNLLSVAGRGGINLEEKADKENIKLFKEEIEALKNHPAILSWYIADEPDGQGILPETLENFYRIITEIDPYHPISVVIMSAEPGRKFANSCDIIMCDTYPVPNSPAKEVVAAVQGLFDELKYEKAIWYVPQTFGGNEWWLREPTPEEIRMMTWGATLSGARGHQAFIRHGLNAFPKNQFMWETYAKTCREIMELTPVFEVNKEISVELYTSGELLAKGYQYNGDDYVVIVNLNQKSEKFKFALEDSSGEAYAYFENSEIPFINGTIDDFIAPFGVKIYRVFRNDDILRAFKGSNDLVAKKNLVADPSFEWGYSIAGNVPAATYGGEGKDRGAHYSIDSRVAHHGEHSLRLVTPTKGGGCNVKLQFLHLIKDKTYVLSVWAKSDHNSLTKNPKGLKFHINFCNLKSEEFTLTDEWKRYEMSATYETVPAYIRGVVPTIELLGEGVAWFDLFEVVADMDILTKKKGNVFEVSMISNIPGADIYYTENGTEPTKESKLYTNSFIVDNVRTIKARLFKGDKSYGVSECLIASHKGVGAKVTYLKAYDSKYPGAGDVSMTDGFISDSRFREKSWQGYNLNDMEVVLDFGEEKEVNKIGLSILHSTYDWIVPPKSVEYFVSDDGENFESLGVIELGEVEDISTQKMMISKDNISKKCRFVKVYAKHRMVMPKWHSVDKAWMFVDEIIVE